MKINSLPRELSSADFLFWLALGWHILVGNPVSVHNSVGEEVGFVGQHSVGDVIEVEKVAEEISDDAHAFGWTVGIAPSGQQSSLKLR